MQMIHLIPMLQRTEIISHFIEGMVYFQSTRAYRLYKMKAYWDAIKERIKQYSNVDQAREWLDKNLSRVKSLFSNYTLRDFIFEPFKAVFQTPAKTIDANIYSVITQVAIINAVLAGLPGRMGVGVYVSMALEGWMAFCIAKHIGIRVEKPSDIWRYFGLMAASAGLIFYIFRILLGFGFSLFSIVPGLNPLILAEIFVTDLVGILFWIGFQEVHAGRPFSIPRRLVFTVRSHSVGLFKHQMSLIKNVLSIENIKIVGKRLKVFLTGDFPTDIRFINGEIFSTAAMAYLIGGQYDKLEGPLGEIFLQAIRLRWSEQFDVNTSVEEIADRFREYDAEQLPGVINTIKGKMFEIMTTERENLDGDKWSAKMHTDESFPGSDITFTNADTQEQLEVSLKIASVDNRQTIDHALERYPDYPIMTNDEAAALYDKNDMVFGGGISGEKLTDITEENLDEMISRIEPINEYQVVIGGTTIGSAAALWPFVMAYLRGRITQEQLEKVFKHILGQVGVKLTSRVVYATVFGPLFAWYLLARGVKGLVVMAEPDQKTYIEFVRTA